MLIAVTTKMEININMNDILREVIMFLEYLKDVQLPLALESLREKLLTRSKNTLMTMTRASPEPYLDMNSGPKSILLKKNEADTEEYVGMEESPKKQAHQDYYETFETDGKLMAIELPKRPERHDQNDYRHKNQILIESYKKLPALQSKNGCHKCGPLYKKEGRKLFMSEIRSCWVALVGTHLLIYRNERQNQPSAIYSIRSYMARPAPNFSFRQKSDSAFEVYCDLLPGSETLQFIARTPKEMDQWIAKVCEIGFNSNAADLGEKRKLNAREGKEVRGTGKRPANTPKKKAESKAKVDVELRQHESPPPLPTRIPRRLPSLPDDSIPSYFGNNMDDEDDIYNKIEDVNGMLPYQNMMRTKTQRADVNDEEREQVEYDDILAFKGQKEKKAQEEKDNTMSHEEEDLYDDVMMLRTNNTTASGEAEKAPNNERPVADDKKEEVDFHDNTEKMSKNENAANRVKNQTEASSKFLQKKSFLERVWSKREMPGKLDKKPKVKVSLSSPQSSSVTDEMSTYDDVSGLMSNQVSATNEADELPEYNCPPPPRPIRPKSPANRAVNESVEELYDDISSIREQSRNHQHAMPQSTPDTNANETIDNAMDLGTKESPAQEELEHYQSPRSDPCVLEVQQTEELYDDVALWVDFKARQRSANEKKDSEDGASAGHRIRNRFSINRRSSRTKEVDNSSETSKRNGSECEKSEESSETSMIDKKNTFQKLISRMETSLAKVSSRSPPALPGSKPINVTFKS